MIVQRTETHIIKETNPIYNWIIEECHRSKNLYNKTLFIYRQAFTGKHDLIEEYKSIIRHGKFISSFELVKQMMKLKDNDYYSMTKKNSATQVICQVDKVMKGWFGSLKVYRKRPRKMLGL